MNDFVVIEVNEKISDQDVDPELVGEKEDFDVTVLDEVFDPTLDTEDVVVTVLIEVREMVALEVVVIDLIGVTDGEPLIDGDNEDDAVTVGSLELDVVGKELVEYEVDGVGVDNSVMLIRAVVVIEDVAERVEVNIEDKENVEGTVAHAVDVAVADCDACDEDVTLAVFEYPDNVAVEEGVTV